MIGMMDPSSTNISSLAIFDDDDLQEHTRTSTNTHTRTQTDVGKTEKKHTKIKHTWRSERTWK